MSHHKMILAFELRTKHNGSPTGEQFTDYLRDLIEKDKNVLCDPWTVDVADYRNSVSELFRDTLTEDEELRTAIDLRDFVESRVSCELKRDYLYTTLTTYELATVLAALRYWQRTVDTEDPPSEESIFFDDEEALSPIKIDALCEKLNFWKQ